MKRSVSVGGLSMGLFLVASAAMAAPPVPQYSAQEIEKTFAAPPAPPVSAGECEKKGMVTGDDGVCEPVKNERGFSLPTRANMQAPSKSSPSAAAPAVQTASIPKRRPAVDQPQPHRDLLITFKTGSSELTEQAQANALVFAEALASPTLAGSRFEVAGYTDAVGAADKNQGLSQQRAEAVKSFLISHGVNESRVVAKGYGATNFADPGHPTSAANRRVEARKVD